MHAYLVIGQSVETEVDNLIKKLKASRIDFTLEKIADSRELIKFTNLSFPTKTAIVINNFNKASEESQNAFLKNLEEPQENLIYVLVANNNENILPTVTSRCQVIEIINSKLEISSDAKKNAQEFLNLDTKAKLLITSKIKDRIGAIEFLNNLILGAKDSLKENTENSSSLHEALKCIRALKANGNVQLQLTNFVLSIIS